MIERTVHTVSAVLGAAAAVCLIILLLSSSADALGRNLIGASLRGAVEYGEVLLVGLAFLSLGYAQRREAHIAVDMFTLRLNPRLAAALEALGLVSILVVLVWFTYATGRSALESTLVGEYRFGLVRVPIWPARWTLPIGISALIFEVGLRTATRGLVAAGLRPSDIDSTTTDLDSEARRSGAI